MTKLEQLAEKAKEAQRAYDTANQEAKTETECEECKRTKAGEVMSKTSEQGTIFSCKANSDIVIKHALGTLEGAFEALKEDKMGKMILAMSLAKVIHKL